MKSFFKSKINLITLSLIGMISSTVFSQSMLLPMNPKFKIGDDMAWANPNFDDSQWDSKPLAYRWDSPTPDKLVYAWYRIKIFIPSSYKKIATIGKGLKLMMGKIDDADQTYFNGKLVGETGSFSPNYKAAWEKYRTYYAPLEVIKWDQENVIAVRICSILGGAGMYEGPYSISSIQWSDFMTVEKSFIETPNKGFITKLKFTNNGNSPMDGVVNYWIKDRHKKIVFSETKPVKISAHKNEITEFETSNFASSTEDIFNVGYEIVENETSASLGYDQIYLADKNIAIPVLKEVKPIIEDKIKNNFNNITFQNQQYKGYLNERFAKNIEQNLLKIDESGMMDSYLHRPGNQYWVGEHVGKYLETACNVWKLTKNPAIKKQMDRMMYELIHTQKEDGYLGTYSPDQYWTSWDVWSHKYNIHGLLAYYSTTGYKPALETCIKMGDLLCKTFGKNANQIDINTSGEHGGMASTSVLDAMVELYKYTADKKYLDFCHYILDAWEQENGPHIISAIEKTGRVKDVGNAKAYEMMSNYVGLIKLYQITGETKFLKIVEMVWQDIAEKRLYITGSTSSRERFLEDGILPAGSENNIGEGCVTATWVQLNQNLFALTGDIKYLNQLEKTVYNHLLASENPENGCISDYTPLMGKKPYSCGISCCKSSVPRAIALIPYFTFGNIKNVPTVLFYESAVYKESITSSNNKKIDATFKIEGNFPESGKLTITVETSKTAEFPLALRVPLWCTNFVAKVGNTVYKGLPNDFVIITKNWKSGEKISVNFDMPIQQISGGKSYPNQIAFQRGPQVLALDKSLNSEKAFELISNSKENIAIRNPNTTNESKFLPKNWIGQQAYSVDILNKNEKIFLVPFAESSQTEGEIRVWLPLKTVK